MNCQDLERMLHLDQSGELPARRREMLAAHLAACAACRARRDEFVAVTRFLGAATAANGPSQAVIDRILLAARTDQPRRRMSVIHLAWFRVLAAAAMLILLLGFVGLTLLRPANDRIPSAGANRMAEVSSLMGMLMEQDEDAVEAHTAAASGDLNGFARQLLILEGLSEDNLEEPADEATRLEERQPTTLQWRSNPEGPSRTCA